MTERLPTRRSLRQSVDQPVVGAPVFVDASGHRLRVVRIAAAVAVALALGYGALLVSAVVGGPTIDAPFLPQPPAAAGQPPATTSTPTPTPTTPAGTTPSLAPGVRTVSVEAPAPASSTAPDPASGPASTPAPAASATPAPASTPSPQPTDPGKSTDVHGSSTSAPGQTRKPTPPARP